MTYSRYLRPGLNQVYRIPSIPNKPLENYINQLNSVILKLPNDSEFILLGDFNVHLSTNSRSPTRQMLNNFSRQLHIDQVITEPTRITETSQTMIVQNKDAKPILDVPCLSFSTEAIDKLYWHPLSHRRYLHRLLTIFKIKNNLTKFNFGLPNTNHTYNTRTIFTLGNRRQVGENRNWFTKDAKNITLWTTESNLLNN